MIRKQKTATDSKARRTMVLLPSVAIATKKDDPIAWAFLGQ